METIDYNDLDPGIRQTVHFLREQGFETSDSGDGVSKFDSDGQPLPFWESIDLIPEAHVAIICAPENLISESQRLYTVLSHVGISFSETTEGSPLIQGTYNPCETPPIGLILLTGVCDKSFNSRN